MATTTTKPPDKYGRPWGDPNYGADKPTTSKPKHPPDKYGRPWGDPNYGADPNAPKKTPKPAPTASKPAPAPAPNPENTKLQADYDQQQKFMQDDYDKQKAFLEQDASLSEQDRALALQELETQHNYNLQQLELQKQQTTSDIAETQRQIPLTLGSIADQFAAQGAFYSKGRIQGQSEAQIASDLALQALNRQLTGQQLSGDEENALFAIKQGQYGLAARQAALEIEKQKWNLDHGFEVDKYQLQQAFEKAKESLSGGGEGGKQLTKADLGTMLRQGFITKNQYEKALEAQGYTHDQAKLMYLSENAKGPLGANGEGKQLSQSQLATFYRQGLFGQLGSKAAHAAYVKNLVGLGYSKQDAEALAASAEQSGPAGKQITKGDINTAISLGVMSPQEGYKALRAMGYSDGAAQLIIADAATRKAQTEQRASISAQKAAARSAVTAANADTRERVKNAKAYAAAHPGYAPPNPAKDKVTVAGVLISAARGAAYKDPAMLIAQHRASMDHIAQTIAEYAQRAGGEPTLSGFYKWYKNYLMNLEGGTAKAADAWFAKYAVGISVAWYMILYGSGYNPEPTRQAYH